VTSFVYPVWLEAQADGGFVVHIRDFFDAATQGDDRAGALRAAADSIGNWIDMLVGDGETVPTPSEAQANEVLVAAPLDAAVLALMHGRMRELGISKSELGRRMGKDERQVRRLLDPHHGTRLKTARAALDALGIEVSLGVAA